MSQQVNLNSIADIFKYLSPDFIKDPFYYYRQMPPEERLLLRSPGYWVTADYTIIEEIFKDKRFKRNFWKNKVDQFGEKIKLEPCLSVMSNWMLMVNPPDHGRLRDLTAPFFSRAHIEKLRLNIEAEANRLIDVVIMRGNMDIISEFSIPFSIKFMHQILGIPEKDRKEVLAKTFLPRRLFDPPTPLSREEMDLENFNTQQLADYVAKLCVKKESNPQNDLISYLLNANNAGQLSKEECVSQIILLLVAGLDTVPHMIGNSILALHQHPHQLNELKLNPSLFPTALHELLRFAPPVHMVNSEASEDIDMCGYLLKKGDKITSLLAAGNRDPKIFQNPDTLDLSRPKKRLLSFSGGIHSCLGMHLALMLFEIGLQALLKKIPNMQLVDLHQPEWNLTYSVHGLARLRAQWH
ncbi:MAG: cytochrome P450 [Candidatus Protochlamydia sp.]|nr:cytochrome P450 [Candidatus Protochlamydia sp.]